MTKKDRPDYVKCIRKGETKEGLCGRYLGFEFAFVDAEHAKANADAEGRMVVCKDCEKKGFMEAGRALDVLVAQKVMGQHVEWRKGVPMWVGKDLPGCPYVLEDGLFGHTVEDYSRDLLRAWEVLEKFHRDGLVVSVGSKRIIETGHILWYALIGMAKPIDEFDMNANIYGEAEGWTAPLAICRAALKAVENPAWKR